MKVVETPTRTDTHPAQARVIALCGWLVIGLSACAALLPFLGPDQGALIIGGMMVAAGLVETVAGVVRHETRKLVMLAGAVTVGAGLLFASEPATHFLPALYIVTGWLAVRAIIFFVAGGLEAGSVKRWTFLSAATDAALAVLLFIGISIATIVVALFGATPPLVASFAWILAISFVTTGLMLLEVASCARAEEV